MSNGLQTHPQSHHHLQQHRVLIDEDQKDLNTLREQINKIQKIKLQYETQKQEIKSLNQTLNTLKAENTSLKTEQNHKVQRNDQQVQTALQSKRDICSMTQPKINQPPINHNVDNQEDKNNHKKSESTFFNRKKLGLKKNNEEDFSHQNLDYSYEAQCPADQCSYSSQSRPNLGFIKNTTRSISPKVFQSGENRRMNRPMASNYSENPKKYMMQNFISELRQQLNSKNLKLNQEHQKQLQYMEYVQLYREENEKLLQMNTILSEKHEIAAHQSNYLKQELRSLVTEKQSGEAQLIRKMRKAQLSWERQFAKMEELNARFETVVNSDLSLPAKNI